MIKIFYGSPMQSKANFIVHPVSDLSFYQNESSNKNDSFSEHLANNYPHVEKEYSKYIRYCKKHLVNPDKTVQYIPTEIWALPMIDTMKNNNVEAYNGEYQYIVNSFGYSRETFADIYKKAQTINATVAILIKSYSKEILNSTLDLIKDVFKDVDVEVWIY